MALIFKILKERTKLNGLMFGEGTLEILPDVTPAQRANLSALLAHSKR